MSTSKATATRSVPFSITLLMLMGLIVVPLASALLWLGFHAVNVLERRSVNQRMSALDYAVATTLTDGLRTITSVGLTLAEAPSFQSEAGHEADDERRRQLIA